MADLIPQPTTPYPTAGLQAWQGDLAGEESAVAGKQGALDTKVQQADAIKDKALTPLEDDMTKSIAQPMPQRPKAEPLPQWDASKPIVDGKDYEGLGTALLAMAVIGGAKSHGNWLGVSAALNGTMEGFLEANQEKADKAYKDYQTQFKAAQAREEQANKEFQDILEDRKLTINEKIQQYKITAAKYDRQDQRFAADQKSIDKMWEQLNAHRSALNAAASKHDDIVVKIDASAAQKAAGEGGGKPTIDDKAINAAAERYNTNGTLPANLGRGKQGAANITAILDRAAELNPDANAAVNAAEFRADASSLSKQTASYDAITAFEKNAGRNGRTLTQLADKVDSTGVPVIESWIRNGRKATGDPDVREFDAQLRIYQPEVAKILTNPNLSGQLSDSARHEVESFLPDNIDSKSLHRVVDRLNNDFEQRKGTLQDQIKETKERMNKVGKPDTGGTPPVKNAKGWVLHTDKNGNKAYVSPDGKDYEEVQ